MAIHWKWLVLEFMIGLNVGLMVMRIVLEPAQGNRIRSLQKQIESLTAESHTEIQRLTKALKEKA